MFRALSTRRRGYEQLGGDEASSSLVPKLSRARSLPSKVFGSPAKIATPAQQAKKASKVHPFFTLFETKRKKKATAKPEFSRYLEYVREGGAWDVATNKPVMYYK
ncbi:hypothetical protein C2S52_023596 [Perilla frutescens var. hirtella]|nr:hypothetical protein C2S52_023596 [Perilla frutescens var. hirtella]KAH6791500.1 hypothetical protein C2S51_006506 [Perilla frutescens var. frutescens]KAH6810178.1 hypothetical protein C2S51_023940 [Perilla frutescens var. frutescens]